MDDFRAQLLLRYIDLIYDAAYDLALWPQVFERLAAQFPAGVLRLAPGPVLTRLIETLCEPRDPESLCLVAWLETGAGTARDIAWGEFAPDDFAQALPGPSSDFAGERPVVVIAWRLEGRLTPIAGVRVEHGMRPATLLEPFMPHLQRAMRMSLRMNAIEGQVQIQRNSLDRISMGIVAIDPSGRVHLLNRVAEEIVARDDGLAVRDGYLCTRRHDSASLLAFLASVVDPREPKYSAVLAVPRAGAQGSYLLRALRVAGADVRARILLFVNDPDSRAPPLPHDLQALFKLSPSEADIASALLQGQRLEQIALDRGVSISTARSQLQAIFGKTDTTRQSDLLRLLASIPRMS